MRAGVKKTWLVIGVLLVPVVGYGIMHLLVYILPVDQSDNLVRLLFTIAIIALGLSIPYMMLKMGVHKAAMDDPQERDVALQDMPKDQDEAGK